MVRIDKLKSNSDPSCEQSREITRKCKSKPAKGKNAKSNNNYQSNSNRKSVSGDYSKAFEKRLRLPVERKPWGEGEDKGEKEKSPTEFKSAVLPPPPSLPKFPFKLHSFFVTSGEY